MDAKNRNLVVRLTSAALYLPLILFSLYRGGAWTGALLGASAAMCAFEYYGLVWGKPRLPSWVGAALAACFPVCMALGWERTEEFGFWSLLVFSMFAWIYFLLRGPREAGPSHVGHALVGVIYGGIGVAALAGVRALPNGFTWVMSALTVTWLNDTAAYFVGRKLGRTKLLPEVSPNKTREGFIGGLLGSVVGMFGVRWLFPGLLTPVDCLIVGLVGGVLGPLGDLCESMLKRAYGVKDSGKMVPGHGGMLDRVDALLFNAPMIYLYARFLRGLL